MATHTKRAAVQKAFELWEQGFSIVADQVNEILAKHECRVRAQAAQTRGDLTLLEIHEQLCDLMRSHRDTFGIKGAILEIDFWVPRGPFGRPVIDERSLETWLDQFRLRDQYQKSPCLVDDEVACRKHIVEPIESHVAEQKGRFDSVIERCEKIDGLPVEIEDKLHKIACIQQKPLLLIKAMWDIPRAAAGDLVPHVWADQPTQSALKSAAHKANNALLKIEYHRMLSLSGGEVSWNN